MLLYLCWTPNVSQNPSLEANRQVPEGLSRSTSSPEKTGEGFSVHHCAVLRPDRSGRASWGGNLCRLRGKGPAHPHKHA